MSWNQCGLGLETTSSWRAHGFGGNLAVIYVFAPFQQKLPFTTAPVVLGFWFNQILILVPTIPSFCKVCNSSFVPGPFLVGFGGMKVGMSMVHLTLFSNLTVPSIYSRTEHHCRLPCQTSAKNLSLNSIAICAIMVQTLCQDDVALYVSRCCADIERNRSKKWDFFLQETMPCTHGPSLYVWMSAVVGAVLIAYDYECAKEVSASLFLGSQKQAFLASQLRAFTVYMYIYTETSPGRN